MKYFPLFADLDKAHVLVAGGGEQATQKVRLLLKTSAQITVVAETVTDELRELEESNAIWIVLRTVPRPRPRRPASRLCRHRRPRSSTPPSPARPRRAAFPSMSSMRPSSPPSSCRPSSTARPSRWRSAPRVPPRCWRARSRPGSRPGCPPISARWPSAPKRCAPSSPRRIPDARSRRRLWERLLQGPFRRAVLSGAEAEADRIFAVGIAGRRGPAVRPRGADRLRPRRSRPAHAQGPAAPAGGRRAGRRPPGQPQDPRIRPPRCRAHLRRQDAGRPHHLAGRDQPHPGARGRSRQGRGPAQGRRPLHLRPRRRGDGRPADRRHRRRGRAGRHGGPCLRRPHRSAGDAARARAPLLGRYRRHRRRRARSRLAGARLARHSVRRLHGRRQRATPARQPAGRRRRSRHPRRHRRERHARERARRRHHARRPHRLRRQPGDRRPRRDLRRPRLGRRPAFVDPKA